MSKNIKKNKVKPLKSKQGKGQKKRTVKKNPLKKSISGIKQPLKTSSKKKSKSSKPQIKSPKPPVKKKQTFSSKKLDRFKDELKKLLEKERQDKLILKDMQGRNYCKAEKCDYPAVVEDYCRIHFFALFKIINKKNQILQQDILKKSYTLLINKYSEDLFNYLLKDLSSDKNFKTAIKNFVFSESKTKEE